MSPWRVLSSLWLIFSLIDPSKEGCSDYLKLDTWTGKDLIRTLPLAQNKDLIDILNCTLQLEYKNKTENDILVNDTLYNVLLDCFDFQPQIEEETICKGLSSQNISFYHLMCLVAKSQGYPPNGVAPEGCKYETVYELYVQVSAVAAKKTTPPITESTTATSAATVSSLNTTPAPPPTTASPPPPPSPTPVTTTVKHEGGNVAAKTTTPPITESTTATSAATVSSLNTTPAPPPTTASPPPPPPPTPTPVTTTVKHEGGNVAAKTTTPPITESTTATSAATVSSLNTTPAPPPTTASPPPPPTPTPVTTTVKHEGGNANSSTGSRASNTQVMSLLIISVTLNFVLLLLVVFFFMRQRTQQRTQNPTHQRLNLWSHQDESSVLDETSDDPEPLPLIPVKTKSVPTSTRPQLIQPGTHALLETDQSHIKHRAHNFVYCHYKKEPWEETQEGSAPRRTE
ncbi:mucin-2 isoform X8 [Pleuronectes platessa]|uniref:mucin-2 isoform X8 n=1 Tax=Pleuronectes platessa TaxID=8262 RepID=UPI00232A2EE1|nr:mucin-2 isoform X8 [Pleuronectes platessa]